ncbi:glycosyltransferase family A protein [Pseudovibrio sp. SPO723]|uniref:glycosyltransferase family 2 protein n=1 Tax=Nesiotobacter zosterae TaxID=392721 RepID=UPI0029C1070B|nr:glycosyltransferase family A protein [Pseudovibrio sp. SPO723]MDX5593398.1 glycosyltransferase family A protein [Pseudovibrio sp. SPO723]
MAGKPVKAQEGWEAPGYLTKLGQDLNRCFAVQHENVVHGISCPCCDKASHYWFATRAAEDARITFANLFVNAQYQEFRNWIETSSKPFVVIADESASNNSVVIGGRAPLKTIYVPSNGVVEWESHSAEILNSIVAQVGEVEGALFLVSAGPMAAPIIMQLWDIAPNNVYLDVGSSIDEFTHQRKTRPYHSQDTKHAAMRCELPDCADLQRQVTVVVGVYGRPTYLKEQIEAIEQQTLRPAEIIVFKDHKDDFDFRFFEGFHDRATLITISRNTGVWGRFAAALHAKTKYVCVFDDDTVPGSKWLQNCLETIKTHRGLLGTNGLLFHPKYSYKHLEQYGWANPDKKVRRVDIVGHSWFFERQWLSAFWRDSDDFHQWRIVGEDIHFAHMLQKYLKLKTYVPPHPPYDIEMFGSLPESAKEKGRDAVAISMSEEGFSPMGKYLEQAKKNGFRLVMRTQLHALFFKIYRKWRSKKA